MSSDAGAEAQRIAAVLWAPRERPRRGPAQGLTVARIVGATVALIEEAGLDALTMRQVAARLGVGAATLYTYVPGRAELLALVVDECAGVDVLPHEQPGGWRERTEAWARSDYADYRARPWVLRLVSGPVVAGPNLLRWYDSALRVVDGIGLAPHEMVAVVDAVDGYVRGQARAAAGEVLAPAGVDEPPSSPGPGPYPVLERLAGAGAFGDPEATFEFGLARLLDGVATLVDTRVVTPAP